MWIIGQEHDRIESSPQAIPNIGYNKHRLFNLAFANNEGGSVCACEQTIDWVNKLFNFIILFRDVNIFKERI